MDKVREVSVRMPRTPSCPPGSADLRLWSVVGSIGASSHFLMYLDSVVDNILTAALPSLTKYYGSKEQAESKWESMIASRIYGLALGCLISVFFAVKGGRKAPIVLGIALDIVGLLFILSMLFLDRGLAPATAGRFINGIGQGIVQTAGAVMLAEIPPMRKRGTALATLTMWACLGEVLGLFLSIKEFLGTPSGWIWAMVAPLVLLIPSMIIMLRAPDSPRHLFAVDKEYEARKALLFYQGAHDGKITADEIMEEIKFSSLDKKDENSNTKQAAESTKEPVFLMLARRFGDGQFVRPILVAIFVQTFVHLDDWLWISYSTPIFENMGMNSSHAQWASLFMSLPQVIASILLLFCFDAFTRRQVLLFPTALSVFIAFGCIIVVWKAFYFGWAASYVIAVLASVDLVAAAICGESAYAIVPELFLPQDKVIGTAIVGIVQNAFGGIITNFVLTSVNGYGLGIVMIPFMIGNIIYFIVNWRFVPETGEKTPQEVSKNFSSEVPGAAWIRSFTEKLFVNKSPFSPRMSIFILVLQCVIGLTLLHLAFQVLKTLQA